MINEPIIYSHWTLGDAGEGASGASSLLFPYWSFTKTAIAVCALRLVEQGCVNLDDRLADHSFTLRQLLNHTSGLPDYGVLPDYHSSVAADEDPWSRDKLVAETLAAGPLFKPGSGWAYSNFGYMLAREHIEEVAGLSFGALFEQLIGQPLGLQRVEFAQSRSQFSKAFWKEAKRYHPGWVYHGCLMGPAKGAAVFLHALLTGNVLHSNTLEQMLERRVLGGAIPGRPWTECGYAIGLMSGLAGKVGRAIGHSGAGPFCVNAVYHFPDRQHPVTVASFAHRQDEGVAENEAVRLAASL